MERPRFFSNVGSFATATLLAGAILFGGCSNNLVGTKPPTPKKNETVKQQAQPNTNAGDTEPGAGHNTSPQD
ncbi:MAG: hypothetical protein ABEL51_15400 [Salinibacter sp.]